MVFFAWEIIPHFIFLGSPFVYLLLFSKTTDDADAFLPLYIFAYFSSLGAFKHRFLGAAGRYILDSGKYKKQQEREGIRRFFLAKKGDKIGLERKWDLCNLED